jgi:8-oxo-dGTP diphosphatase
MRVPLFKLNKFLYILRKKFVKRGAFMLVACGIAEREGKLLVCKRPSGVPYAGAWEFPSEELAEGETLENCVKTAFFDRISAVLAENRAIFAFDSACVPGCRLFTFKVNFFETKMSLNGYKDARWVRKEKLCRLRLHPASVTMVKEIKNFL